MNMENVNMNSQEKKYDFSKGAVLKAANDIPFLDIKKGEEIMVKNDGEYLRVGNLSWNDKKLTEEIDEGIWILQLSIKYHPNFARTGCLLPSHLLPSATQRGRIS